MSSVPTCAYRVDPVLVELLDMHLGPPLDSYVRGWQVWLESNGPRQATLEWRLHPPAGFRMPPGVDPHDLFDIVLQGLSEPGDDGGQAALEVGGRQLRLSDIWEILEVFPAHGDPVEPPELVAAAGAALGGRLPDVAGRADHARLGDLWKGSRGQFSVGQALLDTLEPVRAR